MNISLQANEYKEAIQKSTFLIATDNENVINGLAKSNYNVTPYKVIDFYPNEIPDNVIYYNVSQYYLYSTVNLILKHNKEAHILSTIRWNRPLKSAGDYRALYNHFDQIIREYLKFADANGKLDLTKVKEERKKELVSLANNIKKTTYYAGNETSGESIKKWDKKKGSAKRTSESALSMVIEASEDTNGYYIITEKKNRLLWLSGFFTMGAGFIISPFIPKYQTTVYSTNADRSLGSFRMYNPTKNAVRVQKKVLKFQNKK